VLYLHQALRMRSLFNLLIKPMKTYKVLAIVFMSFTVLITGLTLMRDFETSDDINKLVTITTSLQDQGLSDELLNATLREYNLPTPGTMKASVILTIVVLVTTITGTVMCILDKSQASLVGIGIIVLAIVSMVVHPAMEMGKYGGISPRAAAIIQAVPAILVGISVLLYKPEGNINNY